MSVIFRRSSNTDLRNVDFLDLEIVEDVREALKGDKFAGANILLTL